jgi:hypothetical protein
VGLYVPLLEFNQIQQFASLPPNIHATGNIESMSLLAGQSVGLVDEILPAAEIIRETVNGVECLIRELSAKVCTLESGNSSRCLER